MTLLRFEGKADPLLQWGVLTGFRFFSEGPRRIGLLIQWESVADAKQALAIAERRRIEVPPVYAGGAPTAKRALQLVWGLSGEADALLGFLDEALTHLRRVDLAAAIAPRIGQSLAVSFGPTAGHTVVGLLDDGFAFANRRFMRTTGGLRSLWLWDQNPDSPGAPLDGTTGPSPNVKLAYGGHWSTAELQKLLDDNHGRAEAAYRDARLGSLRRAITHGTHVGDILASNRETDPHSPIDDCDLVFVQFPRSGVEDPSGGWLSQYALDGLQYVLETAGPDTRTVIVNISWGPQTGPHDGSSPLEAAFDAAVAEQKNAYDRSLIITLPSGNSFNAQAHAAFDAAAGGSVDWIVPPDGRTPAHLEVWWPPATALGDAVLHVESPVGEHFPIDQSLPFGLDFGRFDIVKDRLGSSGVYVKLVVHPTTWATPKTRGLHGRWRLRVDPVAASGGVVHVYVARADHNLGAKRLAKTSYLTDAALERHRFCAPAHRYDDVPGSSVRRSGTLNGMGTGAEPWLAGGFCLADLTPAPYTSSGPSRGTRTAPDFSCVTDRSQGRPGVRASGVRSGTRVRLIGTSTAAPQLARKLARYDLETYPNGPTHDPDRDGAGHLEIDPWVIGRG